MLLIGGFISGCGDSGSGSAATTDAASEFTTTPAIPTDSVTSTSTTASQGSPTTQAQPTTPKPGSTVPPLTLGVSTTAAPYHKPQVTAISATAKKTTFTCLETAYTPTTIVTWVSAYTDHVQVWINGVRLPGDRPAYGNVEVTLSPCDTTLKVKVVPYDAQDSEGDSKSLSITIGSA